MPQRQTPTPPPMRLAGLEPVTLDGSQLFVNIGERTNAPEPAPAPAVEPPVPPRYDAPAAAASPRAPMPRVEPTVPEPPVYRPIRTAAHAARPDLGIRRGSCARDAATGHP